MSAGTEGCTHHLIDDRAVANALGARGVAERVIGLICALLGWRYCGDDAGLGVAAQGVLQQPRQLALPVRDVRLCSRPDPESALQATQRQCLHRTVLPASGVQTCTVMHRHSMPLPDERTWAAARSGVTQGRSPTFPPEQ